MVGSRRFRTPNSGFVVISFCYMEICGRGSSRGHHLCLRGRCTLEKSATLHDWPMAGCGAFPASCCSTVAVQTCVLEEHVIDNWLYFLRSASKQRCCAQRMLVRSQKLFWILWIQWIQEGIEQRTYSVTVSVCRANIMAMDWIHA